MSVCTRNRPIRVLHVTTSSGIGGAERLIAGLCRTTSPDEATLDVLTLSPPGTLTDVLNAAGTNCYSLGMRNVAAIPLAFVRLARFMAHGKYDVVHGHLVHGSAAALSAGVVARVPVRVVTRHYSTYLSTYGTHLDRALETMSNRLAFRIFAVGETVRDVLINREGVEPERIAVIRNGIDLAAVRGAATRTERNHPYFTIGTVGALHEYKGHRFAFEAIRRLRDAGHAVRYELIGDGEIRADLGRLADRVGIGESVAFLGFVPDPFPVMNSWDVYLQPSLEEGLSIAVLEAMALGKPVICTTAGEMAQVVEDGYEGLLVEPGDPEAIARAIRQLRSDPELPIRIGEAARLRIERDFNIERTARAYLHAYDELLNGRAA